jgi:hypothetical protein
VRKPRRGDRRRERDKWFTDGCVIRRASSLPAPAACWAANCPAPWPYAVNAVVALLHRSTAVHRNDGRPLSARPWNGTLPPPSEIAVLRGDVREPGLGLDETSLAEIVRGLDLAIHGAAATGFNLSERVYQR